MQSRTEQRLNRLQVFLQQDPDNLSLIGEGAEAAYDARDHQTCIGMLARYAEIAPLPAELRGLLGLAFLASSSPAQAASVFQELHDAMPDDHPTRFNLAFSRALLSDWRGADALLDEQTVEASAVAATLKVQALHHLDELDDALALGVRLSELHPDHEELAAALCVAAMDAEKPDLAAAFAERAPSRHEGLATLGMLRLDASDIDGALALFDRALTSFPDSARGQIGRGLGLLVKGEAKEAASWLDRGAAQFGDHIGSWIASGWAYFAANDLTQSRQRFEKALAIDDTFAETHGALAVIELLEGNEVEGRRRSDIALRLDRNCLSAALAKSLLAERDGRSEAARRIRETAINSPLGPDGRTIGQTLATLQRNTFRS